MVEIMKFNGFFAKILSKVTSKLISDKLNIKSHLDIKNFNVTSYESGTIKLSIDVEVPKDEFETVVNKIMKDFVND